MKLRLFTLIAFSLVLLSNKGGINLPRAGAPGDGIATCGECHAGGNFDPEVQVSLIDEGGNRVDEYVPGAKYTLEVVGSNNSMNSPKTYGFQLVVLDTLNNNKAGQFGALGTNVRLLPIMDRDYLMQSKPRENGVFTAEWTAPEKETGGIAVYISLLATNANGNTSGDKVLSTSFQFNEGISSSINVVEKNQLMLFPTVTSDFLNVVNADNYHVIALNGNTVLYNQTSSVLDVSMLPSGLYFVKAEGQPVQRFVRL